MAVRVAVACAAEEQGRESGFAVLPGDPGSGRLRAAPVVRQVLSLGVAMVFASSCAKRGGELPQGPTLDLVAKWGLESAENVVLKGAPRMKRELTLSRPKDIRGFFHDLRKAVEGGDTLLTVIGSFKVNMANGPSFHFIVLVDQDRRWTCDQVAVQRLPEGIVESYYYLPDRFLKHWRRRFGRVL